MYACLSVYDIIRIRTVINRVWIGQYNGKRKAKTHSIHSDSKTATLVEVWKARSAQASISPSHGIGGKCWWRNGLTAIYFYGFILHTMWWSVFHAYIDSGAFWVFNSCTHRAHSHQCNVYNMYANAWCSLWMARVSCMNDSTRCHKNTRYYARGSIRHTCICVCVFVRTVRR